MFPRWSAKICLNIRMPTCEKWWPALNCSWSQLMWCLRWMPDKAGNVLILPRNSNHIVFCFGEEEECLVFGAAHTRQKKVICGPSFRKRNIQPVTRSHFPSRLMIWVGIKYGAACRWSPVGSTLNSAKFITLMKEIFDDYHSRNALGRAVIFQNNVPSHVSREVCINNWFLIDLIFFLTFRQLQNLEILNCILLNCLPTVQSWM